MSDYWTTIETTLNELNSAVNGALTGFTIDDIDPYTVAGSVAALGDEAINAKTAELVQRFMAVLANPAEAERIAIAINSVAASGVANSEEFVGAGSSVVRTAMNDVLKRLVSSSSTFAAQVQHATANSGILEPIWKDLATSEAGKLTLATNAANMLGGLVSFFQIGQTAISTGNRDAVGEKTIGAIAGIAGGIAGVGVLTLIAGGALAAAPVAAAVVATGVAGAIGGTLGGAIGEWAFNNVPLVKGVYDYVTDGWGEIYYSTWTLFNSSTSYTQPRRDPLTFDLDGHT